MKRIALSIILTIFAFAAAFAVPAKPGVIKHTQSDGTVVSIEIFGDEYNNYTVADGLYTAVTDSEGDYCYAVLKNGHLESSGVKIRPTSRLTSEEKNIAQQSIGIRKTAFDPFFNGAYHSVEATMRRAAENIQKAAKKHEEALRIADWGGNVKGKRNFLVILIEYSDVKFTLDNPNEKFTNLLNQKDYSANGSTGSARDYFSASSSNQFVPTFDVAGPYTLANKRDYYGGGDDIRPAWQICEACELANSEVDFTKYDANGDGDIDLVFVCYAGHNPAEGGPRDAVWPHQWDIIPGYNIDPDRYGNNYPSFDGKKLISYACTSELRGSNGADMSNIGTFCHEFGHAIGLPDWYDTSDGDCLGLSYTSIMNSGNYLNESATPPTHNALERWLLGWTLPKELNATGSYEMLHISNNDSYVMWANKDQTECFIFEARPKGANFSWDKYLNEGYPSLQGYAGGDGMLVYHVDWSGRYYSNWENHTINTIKSHECARLFGADGTTAKQSKQWFFPGSRNITSLAYGELPSFKNWAGEAMPIELTNITVAGDRIFFDAISKEFEVTIRQYDAFLDWTASAEEAAQWSIVYTNKETGAKATLQTTNKYALLAPLTTSTHYHAMVYKSGATEPLYEAEIITHSRPQNPRPALNLNASYKKNDLITLSVKNLECEPKSIQWYIDRQPSSEQVLTLPAGKHHICAVITDEAGNNCYLYRYITVK